MINMTINGKAIEVENGSTVLKAALSNGIYIPNLCYDRRLKPYGGCRLCIVEIEGQRELVSACATQVRNGMLVTTESPKIAEARKTVLEFLLLHHPLDCPVCDKTGECKLQDLAFKYGPSQSRFTAVRKHDTERIDAPVIERNPNRCILCGICIGICNEYQGVGAINFIGRGFDTKISPAFEESLNCESCGQCIDACPVGALGNRLYKFRSQVLFMEEHPNPCPYCGCGCITNLSVREGKIIRGRGREGVGINDGDLCSKGRYGFKNIYSDKRLTTPMIRKNGELVPASWDEALLYVMERLGNTKETHGASAIGAIGSQRCTIEDNYMLQRFMREIIGTDNIDSAARFGYAVVQEAFEKAYGMKEKLLKWDAPLKADYILVVESDLTSSSPVWGVKLIHARNNGAQLTIADPRETKLAQNCNQWLQIKPGTGFEFLNGLMNIIISEGLYNNESAGAINGFEALKNSLSEFTPETVSRITGISEAELKETATAFAKAPKRLIAMSSGAMESTKGLSALLAAANLSILTESGPDGLQIPADFSNTIGLWRAGVRPLSGGLTAYEMLYKPNAVKALYVMGENPLVTFPNSSAVEKTVKALEFLVVQDIFMTDTARLADVVLPVSSWGEKEGTFVSGVGLSQKLSRLVPETGESVPDWTVFRNLCRVANKDLVLKDLNDIEKSLKELLDTAETAPEPSLSFTVPEVRTDAETVSDEFPMILVTSNIQQNAGTHSLLYQKLGSAFPYVYIEVNSADAEKYKIKEDGFVRVTSKRGEVFIKAMISDLIPEGTVFAPIHFAHAMINTVTYPPTGGITPMVAIRIEAV